MWLTTASGSFSATVISSIPSSSTNAAKETLKPVVILLHGFPDLPHSFLPLANQLCSLANQKEQKTSSHAEESMTCIIPHLRGYEASSVQPNGKTYTGYTMVELGQDLIDWMRILLSGTAKRRRRTLNNNMDEDQHPEDKQEEFFPSLGTKEGFLLVGHDWGSVVAQTAVAMLHRSVNSTSKNRVEDAQFLLDRMKGLILIAVPPMQPFALTILRHRQRQVLYSWYMLLMLVPWLPLILIRWFSSSLLIGYLWRSWSPTMPKDVAQQRAAGVWQHLTTNGSSSPSDCVCDAKTPPQDHSIQCDRAAISYYRCMFNIFHEKSWESFWLWTSSTKEAKIGRGLVPTLAIHGSNDGCIEPVFFKLCCEKVSWIPEDQEETKNGFEKHREGQTASTEWREGTGVKCVTIPDVGHWPHLEAVHVVSDLIVSFMRSIR